MGRRSLRLNLILWFTSIFALILALSDYVTYRVLRQVLVGGLDTSLISMAAERSADSGDSTALDQGLDRHHQQFTPRFVQVLDNQGQVVGQYGLGEGSGAAITETQLAIVMSGGVVTGDGSVGGQTSRIAAVKGLRDGEAIAVVIGAATDALDNTTSRIAMILLMIDVVAVAASVAGGSLIIGKALRPVDHITQRARQIGGGDLRRRLEYMDSSAEMVHLTSVLNEMFDKLQRLFESQKQFVQDAAHEIRSPLAALRCRLEVVLRQRRDADHYKQVIEGALDDATRLTGLADDLFLLARVDSDNFTMDFREVLLSEVVSAVYSQLMPVAEANHLKFTLAIVSDCLVYADRHRLQQAFRNIAENSLKYTPSGGLVSLEVDREGVDGRVTIVDTGIGIPAEDHAAIFRRFYRVDRARSRSDGGTGLGLAICDQIIRAHQGRIEVQSEPGHGSRFIVYLASATSLVDSTPADEPKLSFLSGNGRPQV
jgi:heavy metal sensor kinase